MNTVLDFERKLQEMRDGIEYLKNARDEEVFELIKVISSLRAEIKQLKGAKNE